VRRSRWTGVWLLGLLALPAGCGDLPRPFMGEPGVVGRRLSQPPPARLAVATSPDALLGDAERKTYAGAVAEALVGESVPAVAGESKPGDWRLVLGAKLDHASVLPSYTVENPKGEQRGSVNGKPVPAEAWARGDPAVLEQAAGAAAPAVATLLTSIEAAIQQADPNSLVNRPARVVVKGVTGAPGDGNESLARDMRAALPRVGEVVQEAANGADFSLAGVVHTASGAGGSVRVEIQWIVADPAGRERGRIVQINEVPRGTLDGYWGDVALVVAQEAAGGVRDVILNQTAARQAAQREGEAAERKAEDAQPAAGPEAPSAPASPLAPPGKANSQTKAAVPPDKA